MSRFLTTALYKFVELPDHADLQAPLLELCQRHQVKGTLLLAGEGINGTIAGAPDDVHAVLAWLRSDVRLAELEHRESWADAAPFHRLKVRLKAEIVTMHVDGLQPARMIPRRAVFLNCRPGSRPSAARARFSMPAPVANGASRCSAPAESAAKNPQP